jgi:hypothetical protein
VSPVRLTAQIIAGLSAFLTLVSNSAGDAADMARSSFGPIGFRELVVHRWSRRLATGRLRSTGPRQRDRALKAKRCRRAAHPGNRSTAEKATSEQHSPVARKYREDHRAHHLPGRAQTFFNDSKLTHRVIRLAFYVTVLWLLTPIYFCADRAEAIST